MSSCFLGTNNEDPLGFTTLADGYPNIGDMFLTTNAFDPSSDNTLTSLYDNQMLFSINFALTAIGHEWATKISDIPYHGQTVTSKKYNPPKYLYMPDDKNFVELDDVYLLKSGTTEKNILNFLSPMTSLNFNFQDDTVIGGESFNGKIGSFAAKKFKKATITGSKKIKIKIKNNQAVKILIPDPQHKPDINISINGTPTLLVNNGIISDIPDHITNIKDSEDNYFPLVEIPFQYLGGKNFYLENRYCFRFFQCNPDITNLVNDYKTTYNPHGTPKQLQNHIVCERTRSTISTEDLWANYFLITNSGLASLLNIDSMMNLIVLYDDMYNFSDYEYDLSNPYNDVVDTAAKVYNNTADYGTSFYEYDIDNVKHLRNYIDSSPKYLNARRISLLQNIRNISTNSNGSLVSLNQQYLRNSKIYMTQSKPLQLVNSPIYGYQHLGEDSVYLTSDPNYYEGKAFCFTIGDINEEYLSTDNNAELVITIENVDDITIENLGDEIESLVVSQDNEEFDLVMQGSYVLKKTAYYELLSDVAYSNEETLIFKDFHTVTFTDPVNLYGNNAVSSFENMYIDIDQPQYLNIEITTPRISLNENTSDTSDEDIYPGINFYYDTNITSTTNLNADTYAGYQNKGFLHHQRGSEYLTGKDNNTEGIDQIPTLPVDNMTRYYYETRVSPGITGTINFTNLKQLINFNSTTPGIVFYTLKPGEEVTFTGNFKKLTQLSETDIDNLVIPVNSTPHIDNFVTTITQYISELSTKKIFSDNLIVTDNVITHLNLISNVISFFPYDIQISPTLNITGNKDAYVFVLISPNKIDKPSDLNYYINICIEQQQIKVFKNDILITSLDINQYSQTYTSDIQLLYSQISKNYYTQELINIQTLKPTNNIIQDNITNKDFYRKIVNIYVYQYKIDPKYIKCCFFKHKVVNGVYYIEYTSEEAAEIVLVLYTNHQGNEDYSFILSENLAGISTEICNAFYENTSFEIIRSCSLLSLFQDKYFNVKNNYYLRLDSKSVIMKNDTVKSSIFNTIYTEMKTNNFSSKFQYITMQNLNPFVKNNTPFGLIQYNNLALQKEVFLDTDYKTPILGTKLELIIYYPKKDRFILDPALEDEKYLSGNGNFHIYKISGTARLNLSIYPSTAGKSLDEKKNFYALELMAALEPDKEAFKRKVESVLGFKIDINQEGKVSIIGFIAQGASAGRIGKINGKNVFIVKKIFFKTLATCRIYDAKLKILVNKSPFITDKKATSYTYLTKYNRGNVWKTYDKINDYIFIPMDDFPLKDQLFIFELPKIFTIFRKQINVIYKYYRNSFDEEVNEILDITNNDFSSYFSIDNRIFYCKPVKLIEHELFLQTEDVIFDTADTYSKMHVYYSGYLKISSLPNNTTKVLNSKLFNIDSLSYDEINVPEGGKLPFDT